ncbi:Uncharacterised protein [Sphingobacterium spiritivorum]|uniref:Uncharacterized protein n=1 Tax=Sphingobacterium spiritivorum TaxID=258 RepID=A0A380CS20_SPHSI|nr:hypothetical protein [Sphingobacterium spiritivorum]SUJ26224.1 Uncharacterised protein [Sphingobacterium spiritivorum]
MQTEKIYELMGCKIPVVFTNQLISIKGPADLKKYLSEDIDNRSAVLVRHIKKDYFDFANKELLVTDDSMIIEIWGHIFASHIAGAIKNLVQLRLIEDVADFVIKRGDVIDCGESEVDSNRKIWDILSGFKGIILTFM